MLTIIIQEYIVIIYYFIDQYLIVMHNNYLNFIFIIKRFNYINCNYKVICYSNYNYFKYYRIVIIHNQFK